MELKMASLHKQLPAAAVHLYKHIYTTRQAHQHHPRVATLPQCSFVGLRSSVILHAGSNFWLWCAEVIFSTRANLLWATLCNLQLHVHHPMTMCHEHDQSSEPPCPSGLHQSTFRNHPGVGGGHSPSDSNSCTLCPIQCCRAISLWIRPAMRTCLPRARRAAEAAACMHASNKTFGNVSGRASQHHR